MENRLDVAEGMILLDEDANRLEEADNMLELDAIRLGSLWVQIKIEYLNLKKKYLISEIKKVLSMGDYAVQCFSRFQVKKVFNCLTSKEMFRTKSQF